MLDHFISKIFATKKLKGTAKAMVVTQSIESAIRYFFALRGLLEKQGDPFKIAVAFSDKKTVGGIEHSEDSLNGFAEKDTRDRFDDDDFRLLVVANKYLTGLDQPKLCAMYVDKKLQGVLAVQALSRLNRAANRLGKKRKTFLSSIFTTRSTTSRRLSTHFTPLPRSAKKATESMFCTS